jgi:hypothetical protein
MAQDSGWTNTAKVRAKQAVASPPTFDAETGEQVEERRSLFTHVGDLLGNLKPIQWLVENYLETDALSLVYGPSGGGKSFTVVDIACCVATGTAWHGMPVLQGPVFYIAGEGHNGLARRFAAWQKARGIPLKDAPLYKSNKAVMMLDANAAAEMSAEVARLCELTGQVPSLVVIDTLARNFGDGDENKTPDANKYIEHADAYIRRRWGCNVMTVHHSGHDSDRARGSSSFKGAVDQEIWVKSPATGLVEFQVTKMKEAEIPSGRRFKITQIGLGVEDDCGIEITGACLEVDGNPLEFVVGKRTNGTELMALDVIKAMHPRWPGVPPMVAALGCSERSLTRIMGTMKDQGLVIKQKGGKGYDLAEKAIDDLSLTGFLAIENRA